MPIKEITNGGLFLSDGTKIMDIQRIESMDIRYEPSDKEDLKVVNTFHNSLSGEITLENCEINESLFNQCFRPTYQNPLFSSELLYAIPVRPHKKKRIIKKWLKRYGVKVDHLTLDFQVITYNTQTSEAECEMTKESVKTYIKFYKAIQLYEYACKYEIDMYRRE